MRNIWLYLGLALAGLIAVFVVLIRPGMSQAADITLTWTAPADNVGVVKYDLRWSATRPDTTSASAKDAWWVAATPVSTVPAPAAAGTTQTVLVPGFSVGSYYFVIRSKDAAGNWSDWSNVAGKQVLDTTPPARIVDLR